jgi:hypothetical protein
MAGFLIMIILFFFALPKLSSSFSLHAQRNRRFTSTYLSNIKVRAKTKQKKGHFAEEFFAFSKNRSKTPRRFAPESRSFLRIFCTEGLQGCALTFI